MATLASSDEASSAKAVDTRIRSLNKRRRSDMVAAREQAAIGNHLEYMAHYPPQILHTTDVHLVLSSCVLPVHSFVLMASSLFFSELISACQAEAHDMTVTIPIVIPLQDITEEALRVALTFLYMEMQPGGVEPGFQNVKQAKQLADFGHKYRVKVMHAAADCYLQGWLRSGGFDGLKYEERKPKAVFHTMTEIAAGRQRQAQGVISLIKFAEGCHLPDTISCCAHWLVENYSQIASVHKELAELGSDTQLSIKRWMSVLIVQRTDPCAVYG